MAWTIRFERGFERDLRALDRNVQRQILSYLEHRVATAQDPRDFGKPLSHELTGLWRYRVGDFRIICRFQQELLVIVAVGVGHRSTVYTQ